MQVQMHIPFYTILITSLPISLQPHHDQIKENNLMPPG